MLKLRLKKRKKLKLAKKASVSAKKARFVAKDPYSHMRKMMS